MLLEATETLSASAPANLVSASVQLIAANVGRSGLNISLAAASANPLYLLLGTGTASAANFHVCVPAGSSWDGMIGVTVWRGAVQGFIPTAAGQVGVAEA